MVKRVLEYISALFLDLEQKIILNALDRSAEHNANLENIPNGSNLSTNSFMQFVNCKKLISDLHSTEYISFNLNERLYFNSLKPK